MPLLILCGQPCSGKSSIAGRIAAKLRTQGVDIQIVNEEVIGLERNEAYKGAFSVIMMTFERLWCLKHVSSTDVSCE